MCPPFRWNRVNAKINKVKGELPSITNLAATAAHNSYINEIKGKMPTITNLASTIALTPVENKIPNVSNLVRKTDYNTKISEIEKKNTDHDQYITTPEFNTLTAENVTTRLARENLTSKGDTANFVKNTAFGTKLKNLYSKITLNKTKHILCENKLKKLLDEIENLQRCRPCLISVKATFSMQQYFKQFIVLLKDQVILKNFYRGNLKVCQLKNLLLLLLMILLFLHQLDGTKIQIFVEYLKEAA